MYASDITHRKRNQAIYRDLQRQKAWFAEGGTIRIQYQKGGSDYAYMAELEKGCVENTCILNQPEYQATTGDGLATMNPNEFPAIDFSGVAERGYGYTTVGTNAPYPLPGTLDDGVVPIPMYGADFYFFGTNYGKSNQIYWNSNNAIVFGNPLTNPKMEEIDLSSNCCPAILLGNFDRRLDALYGTTITTSKNVSITTLLVFYQNTYLNSNTNLNECQYQVRLIRQLFGSNKQFIEVRTKYTPSEVGYVYGNDYGYGLNRNTDNNLIDSTKISSYDITDGTAFNHVFGTTFSTANPANDSSFVLESDSLGYGWRFTNNASLNL